VEEQQEQGHPREATAHGRSEDAAARPLAQAVE
jgi:hypothetical protein